MKEAPHPTTWAAEEFADVRLGDKRLDARLVTLLEAFSDAPESPINQACADWAETKAAYRFFQNQNVDVRRIVETHAGKTVVRARQHPRVLAIQDTSYFVYSRHPKTQGLTRMSLKKGQHVQTIYSHGLMMHMCLAVTTEGLPLGLLDQRVVSRKPRSNTSRDGQYAKPHDHLPVEKKESYRWLETLANTKKAMGDAEVVAVADREADCYDLFRLSDQIGCPVLVRANADRTINRGSRYAEKSVERLWEHMGTLPEMGTYAIEIPRRAKGQHCTEREARTATVSVRFGAFRMNPPRNNTKHSREALPDIAMHAVYVLECDPPDDADAVEWLLLTNLPVTTFEEACEIVRWYSLRWRIEMFFKVLKSGFRVEACRLERADRLTRYLTVMSIVAWRLFMITLVARTDPARPCSTVLADHEWKILFRKATGNRTLPQNPPPIAEAVVWIAKLGGFLARKCDGPPGTLTLWRGWKRLVDLTEGWNLAVQS